MSDSAGRLQDRLGHRFGDPGLLERALTHRSAGSTNNERLEFLGDAVLNFLVAQALFERHPQADEGSLTRWRAHLVRRETLAEVARELELGPGLRLGSGELKSGGRDRDSILADALEAVLGAVLLDAGVGACRDAIGRILGSRVEAAELISLDKDPKTRLQESLQARGLALPEYRVASITGAAHEQEFRVECEIHALESVSVGVGSSRRRAEQAAAQQAIEALGV